MLPTLRVVPNDDPTREGRIDKAHLTRNRQAGSSGQTSVVVASGRDIAPGGLAWGEVEI
jgi:hypothetical protein